MADVAVNRTIEDPIASNQFRALQDRVGKILNASTLIRRLGVFGEEPDPRRSISDECGYLRTDLIELEHYQAFYDRNPIAKKVVELLPKHSWQVQPLVFEDDDANKETEFEKAVKDLGNKLRGESFYQDNEGDPIWEHLLRLDILSGIGHYGTMLIGVGGPEGEDLSQPLSLDAKAKRELTFLRVFPERLSSIVHFDRDSSSPHFGFPEVYSISFDDNTEVRVSGDTSVRPTVGEKQVHWTRVIHGVDQGSSNEVFGIPRMRPVFNRLQDLDKLYGGSAEMYWKGAFPGYSFETHPSLGGDVEIDTDALKIQQENWINGLQRTLATTGMSVNSLSPQVVDPTPQINTQLEAICIEQDCPKRIFMGSERGELASSQDRNLWHSVLQARRNNHVTPKIIVPTFNRFIQLGILPKPAGFSAVWPEIETASPLEKADIAIKITQAIVAYIAGGGEELLPIVSFLTMVLGFSQEEAEAILEVIEKDNREMILDIGEEDEKEAEEAISTPPAAS